jgi:hypothetical protein
MKVRIDGITNARTYINNKGKNLGKDFKKQFVKRTRDLSQKLQQEIADSVDKGPVPFTKRSILYKYSYTATGVKTSIRVKDIQAKYLYDVLVKDKKHAKFIPTSAARLTKQGNISGLKNNLRKGRYKIVKQKGKERLIDTNQKKQKKRVIGVREVKKREMIYDFYHNAERGAFMIFRDIKGTFKVRKR